jgi:pimeloyl-ACP methyl ester carboxylesterase
VVKRVNAGDLEVAYQEAGEGSERVVFLLHGFPYDIHAYDEVTPLLESAGCRVITPYLRGYGPTRFLSAQTPRSGQQAVLAHDLLALMDELEIPSAVMAGYDWGGRAGCIVAALWPERIRGLVTVNGYNVHDVPASLRPSRPENEFRHWYQYYFQTERGRKGLELNRYQLCKLLWRLWSPNWRFDEETYKRTAASFDNPDFVEVVIHSYRVRYGLAPGDPAVEETERRLTAKPKIGVPTVAIDGDADGVMPIGGCEDHAGYFTGPYQRIVLPGIGHNPPQEAPRQFADAVLCLL